MTEPSKLIVRQNPSNAEKLARIRTLEALILSDLNNLNNLSFHAELALAYLAGRFDEGIAKYIQYYKLNMRNTKGSEPETRINSTVKAATTAGTIGQHLLNHSRNILNTSPEQAEEYWLKGMKWKKQEHRLISTLINSDPSKKHDLAMISGKIGQEYLDASERLRTINPKQAEQYWLNGMKWKEKSWRFDEELSQTDPSTLENCAKTAGHIGQEYLKASKRLRQANPKQAEQYWLKGMEWKEKAYTSYEELSHTDPSKKQDCALTAAQLGKEFANQENFEKAVEWYEKALQHDPSNKFIIQELEALAEALEILEASEEVNRARY